MDPNQNRGGSNGDSGANQPQYGQPQYGTPPAGQPQYPQPPYGQPPYGQPQYTQPPYPQPPYVQPQYSPIPQGAVVPIGEGWAPGVHPVALKSGSKRLRWGIAGAIVLCIVVVSAAGAFVLSGGAGAKSLTAGAAPKDTIAFLEVRTDLPGDQHTKLADLLSHFPGFADRAQFDSALDELLNRITSSVSPDLTYTAAFKPWMEGEVSIAMENVLSVASSAAVSTPLPVVPGASVAPVLPATGPTYTPPGVVAIVALKDRSAAETWVASELSRQGLKTTSQDYAGSKLYTIGSNDASSDGSAAGAYAVTDRDLLFGTVPGVEAALDTKTKGSLADDANYQTAMKSFSGDSLARFYVDAGKLVGGYIDSYNSMISMFSGTDSPMPTLGLSGKNAPAWVAGSIRAESDRAVVEIALPRPADSGLGNHASTLASVLPASTVDVEEIHSIGKLITDGMAAAQAQLPAGSADTLQTVKQALAMIGGTDWIGDGAVVVTKDGSTFGGGLVLQAADASTASAKLALLTNLATIASFGSNITSHEETYKGVAITVIDIPPTTSGISLGNGVSLTVPSAVEVAVAAKDNMIVAGYTDAFVKAVIDTTPSTSLASQPDYSKAMGAAGSSNEGSFYVNLPALEDTIGQSVSPSRWSTDYKPYFDHVGGLAGAVIDGNTVIVRLVITTR